MGELYIDLVEKYPIVSLEDGVAENDTEGWLLLTRKLDKKIQLVGDDNFVTNPEIFVRGIADGIANAILIKLNQIGPNEKNYTRKTRLGTVILGFIRDKKALQR